MTPGICTREGSMYFKTLTRLHLWGHGNDSFCMSSVAVDQENHVACSGSLSKPFWNRSPGIGYKNRFFSCDFWSWVSGTQAKRVTYPQTQLKGTSTRGLGHKVASQLLWLSCICFTFPIQFSFPSQERTKHLDSKPLSSSLQVLDNKCFLFLKCFLKNCCQLWGWRGISMVIKRIWFLFLSLMWWLTTINNSSSRLSKVFLQLPWTPGTYLVQAKHSHKIKNKINLLKNHSKFQNGLFTTLPL